MTIETGIENAGVYIDTLDDTYPASGDDLVEGDNHIRGIKNCLLNTFPAITGAVTSTHTELNLLDGATVTTAEINYNDINTLGVVQASKTVTANAYAYITFSTAAATRALRWDTGSKAARIAGDTSGDIYLYDETRAAYVWRYDQSVPSFIITPAITASGGITGNVAGNVTSTGTNSMHTLTVTNSFTMPNSTVTTAKIADGNVTAAKIVNYTVGTTYQACRRAICAQKSSGADVKIFEAYMYAGGTVTVRMERWTQPSQVAQIYVNGVATGTSRNFTSTASFDENITVSSGDRLQVYGHYGSPTSANIRVTILAANANLVPASPLIVMPDVAIEDSPLN